MSTQYEAALSFPRLPDTFLYWHIKTYVNSLIKIFEARNGRTSQYAFRAPCLAIEVVQIRKNASLTNATLFDYYQAHCPKSVSEARVIDTELGCVSYQIHTDCQSGMIKDLRQPQIVYLRR